MLPCPALSCSATFSPKIKAVTLSPAPTHPPAPGPRRPIRDLPDELISQIAAGEVVERPASVVRELVDNALDAGASQVTVRLMAGGVRLILVEDDGLGIPREELPVALRRHATSKIASLQDLEAVGTMGFRGEALAAINSIADMSLLSRTLDTEHAWQLDGRTGELTPAARNRGTSVEVRELFYATPARRKFLKTDATELAHCIEAVRRHALVRPDVGFAIWHEGKLVEQWRACSHASAVSAHDQRLADVLGSDFVAQSVAVHYESAARRTDGQPAVRVEHQFLRHHTDFSPGHGVIGHDIAAMHQYPAACGARQTRQNADERGFAGAVGPQQTEKLALLDVKAHVIQRPNHRAGLISRGRVGFGDGLK